MTPAQLWEAALGALEVRLAGPSFDTFLRGTRGLSLQGDRLVVGAPSPFAVEYLEKRLRGAAQEAVRSVAQGVLTVQFQVADPDGAPAPQGPAPSSTSSPSATPRGKYTLSSFVVEPCNHLAHAAAVAAAQQPGLKYNPLFLHSPVGLGKTHLLRSIQHHLATQGLQAVYVNGEQFTTEFVSAVRRGGADAFRRKYHGADALLFDDIQFLSGKRQTQDTLFHVFNALHHQDRQIVLASDRPPQALTSLGDRLRSRLDWGLTVEIQPPDHAARLHILRAKVRRLKSPPSDEVLVALSRPACGSIRELEGRLTSLVARAELMGQTATLATAASVLAEAAALGHTSAPIAPNQVIAAVAAHHHLTAAALVGPARDRVTSRARHIAIYLLREHGSLSLAEIGRLLGGRDHSSIGHAYRKIQKSYAEDLSLQREIQEITSRATVPAAIPQ